MKDIDLRIKLIMVDFSAMFDTDFGTVKYLISQYPKSNFFYPYCKDWTDYFIKCKVITRSDINPITILLKDEYKDQADGLYKELQEKHWNDVLKLSNQTDIVKLINATYRTVGYTIWVNCSNLREQTFIEKLKPDWKIEMNCDNAKKFFCLFIHDINYSFINIKNIDCKSIYIYDHKPNFINFKEKILKDVALAIAPTNELSIIGPYCDLVLPDDCDMTPDDVEVNTNGRNKEYGV